MPKNGIRTSSRVATKASELLRDGRTSAKTKSVAAGCLGNRGKQQKTGLLTGFYIIEC